MGILGMNFGGTQPQAASLLGQFYDPAAMKRQMISQALMQAGVGLLGQGYSSTPKSILGELGTGLKGAVEGAQQGKETYMDSAFDAYSLDRQKNQDERKLLEDQRREQERMERKKALYDFTSTLDPAKRQFAEAFPDYAAKQYGEQMFPDPNADLDRRYKEAQIANINRPDKPAVAPSSVREYEYAQSKGYKGSYEQFLKMAAASKAGIQLPGEMGSRIGLGDEFTQNDLPGIKEDVKAGKATGPIDYVQGLAGRGRSGEIRRRLLTGVDALRRNLTGAGMGVQEAEEYVSRYLPGLMDDSGTLGSKIDGLERDLGAVRKGAIGARDGSLGASGSGNGIPPDAASELMNDPTPEAIAEFNAVFGDGAAESVLQGQ